MIVFQLQFWIFGIIIAWAMFGYKISLKNIMKLFPNRKNDKDYSFKPTATVIIVAHNEDKVILNKLKNVIDNDYPKDKIEYIVASDYSTDNTNEIVRKFILENKNLNIKLY